MTPAIGIGDLLRAWNVTERDPAVLLTLVRVLGLAAPVASSDTTTLTTKDRDGESGNARNVRSTTSQQTVDAVVGVADTEPAVTVETARSSTAEPLVVTELPAIAPDLPMWLTGKQLPLPTKIVRVAPAPLFAPPRERALLSAAARTLRAEGAVDVERVIGNLARCSALRTLPRRRILSLGGGIQLILDRSPWMAPFAEDVTAIAARFRQVVGGLLDELSIAELPPYVRRLDEIASKLWVPPRAGAAIVVVTDLGRSARRRGEQAPSICWEAFLHELVFTGFAPIAVVPGRRLIGRNLRTSRNTLILSWDRGTRVAEVTRFRKVCWR